MVNASLLPYMIFDNQSHRRFGIGALRPFVRCSSIGIGYRLLALSGHSATAVESPLLG